ncbi:MAG: DUF1810 domain-containing protein [Muribaculaceae bacterium]|nr:DUF1810 domain-containing protein [Muribaculaceae bacterium]
MNNQDLERFVEVQSWNYEVAVAELRAGKKRSHWMWYIFPQMRGLGSSSMAEMYGIAGLEEARRYLEHEVLGMRLREVCEAILGLSTDDAHEVFGDIDSLKLKSSMTLFDLVCPDDIFVRVIDKYYEGERDNKTLKLLEGQI